MNIDRIWNNILLHEGEVFRTVKELEFTYVVINDHEIVPYRNGESRWTLSKNVFAKALEFDDFSCNEFNDAIIGASYVRGLLNDRRIKDF